MDQNYIEIDFTLVKGYKKLSDNAKAVFQRVYKSHNNAQGIEHKNKWLPQSVKEYASPLGAHLIVHFANGEWLHYAPTGHWY